MDDNINLSLSRDDFLILSEAIEISKAFALLTAYANDDDYKSFNRASAFGSLNQIFYDIYKSSNK